MHYCCNKMSFFVEEEKVDIYYNPEFRKYSIGMKNGTSAVQIIFFCPWCGCKLPESLFDLFFDTTEKISGKKYYELDLEGFVKEHPEFQTDEWWRKRGL